MSISKITQKRLAEELKMIQKDPLDYLDTYPNSSNILEWYFILAGPPDTQYTGGYYIGTLFHHPEYPAKPPDFMMHTPSGRFEVGKRICMTNTGYHSNEWSSIWNISSLLQGFISIFTDDKESGLAHIHKSKEECQELAKQSFEFNKKNLSDKLNNFTKFLIYNSDSNLVERMKTVQEISSDLLAQQEKKKKKKQEKLDKKNNKSTNSSQVEPKLEPEKVELKQDKPDLETEKVEPDLELKQEKSKKKTKKVKPDLETEKVGPDLEHKQESKKKTKKVKPDLETEKVEPEEVEPVEEHKEESKKKTKTGRVKRTSTANTDKRKK